ncbi:protein singles bar-like [Ornithodoros turicata]|uniref:protein singles bar-like n=1 Tax=Ornithodoros turicata TaxID=34597 RepID=UPI0031395C0F
MLFSSAVGACFQGPVMNRAVGRPTVRTVPVNVPLQTVVTTTGDSGVCCGCFNFGIFNTRAGIYKLVEVILGAICLYLVLLYGTPVWLMLGPAYAFYLTSVAASLMGSSVFFFSYLLSRKTYLVARNTVLETVQNTIAFLLLSGSSAFLVVQTSLWLWPLYLLTPFFQAYPAMMAAGVLGCCAAAVHAFDGILAFRDMKQ